MSQVPLEQYRDRLGLPSLEDAARHAQRRHLGVAALGRDGADLDGDMIVAIARAHPGSVFVDVPCEAEITVQPAASGGRPTWRARLTIGAETVIVGDAFLNGEAAEFAAELEAKRRGFTVVGATYTPEVRVLELGRAESDCRADTSRDTREDGDATTVAFEVCRRASPCLGGRGSPVLEPLGRPPLQCSPRAAGA